MKIYFLILETIVFFMTIRNWEGISLLIGPGGIGRNISDYLLTNAPKLEVYFVDVI